MYSLSNLTANPGINVLSARSSSNFLTQGYYLPDLSSNTSKLRIYTASVVIVL